MESKLEIRQLAESESSLWDKLVEASPQATVFHTLVWLKTIEKHTNTKLILLVGLDNEEVFAAIPFFYKKARGFLKRLFSPPYNTLVPYLGPIFPYSDKSKRSKWESRLIRFSRELDNHLNSTIRPDCICISTSTNLQDIRGFLWTGYVASPNFTYIGDISDKALTWEKLSSSIRRGIKKAEREGVEVAEGDIDGYRFTRESFMQDLQKDGITLNLSNEYFQDLYANLHPHRLKIFVSKRNGETIGGIAVTAFKDTVCYWLGGVRANLNGVYPNYLLLWKTIEWANSQGYRYFDLFGADVPSISLFKSGLNFELRTFYDLRRATAKYNIFVNGITKHIVKA